MWSQAARRRRMIGCQGLRKTGWSSHGARRRLMSPRGRREQVYKTGEEAGSEAEVTRSSSAEERGRHLQADRYASTAFGPAGNYTPSFTNM